MRETTERKQGPKVEALRAALVAFRPVFAARERAARLARRAALVALLLLLPSLPMVLYPPAVSAQANDLQDPGTIGGSAEHSGDVDGGTRQNPWEQLVSWSEGGNLNTIAFKTGAYLFERLVRAGIDWLGSLLGNGAGEGITIQLPRSMTTEQPWVIAGAALFQRLFATALYGAFLLALVVTAVGGLFGFTTVEAKGVMAVTVVLWQANRVAPRLVGHLQDLANALAASFADPTRLLPGWDRMQEMQRGSGEGLMAIGAGTVGAFLSVTRWFTLLGFNILFVLLSAALLMAIHPATRPLFTLWWRSLLGLLFVQVPIALAVGQGQALMGRYGTGTGGGAMLLAAIACFILAARMPRLVGGIAGMASSAASQVASTAGRAGMGIATGGGAVAAGPATGGGHAAIHEVAASRSGTVAGSGPTWRTQPLLPAPMTGGWSGSTGGAQQEPMMDLEVLSVE